MGFAHDGDASMLQFGDGVVDATHPEGKMM